MRRCPYCVKPILKRNLTVQFGQFEVHAICHQNHIEQGKPYLRPDGSLQYHEHIIPPDAARALFDLYAANQNP